MMNQRGSLPDLEVFLLVARLGGFRRAATVRGVSGSAVSHAMRGLEAKLGVRLFHRTSRSVKLTSAGEALLNDLGPHFDAIEQAVDRLERYRSFPTGRVKITALRDAAHLLLEPRLAGFAAAYPEIEVEISVDDRFVDMVAEGFDAGIRYGDTVSEGMIAARLTREMDWVVVGAPSYLNSHGRPQEPKDLMSHRCIRVRTGRDLIYQWELGNGDQTISIDVPGHMTLGDSELSIRMAERGVGLFYCLKDRVKAELDRGGLEVVLPDWASSGPGFYAYYASHRQVPSALRLFLDYMKN